MKEGTGRAPVRGARLRRMLEDLQVVVWESDAELRVRYVSGRAIRIFGYPVEEWVGSASVWQRLIHPEDYEDFVSTASRLVETASETEVEFRAVTAEGGELWVRALMGALPVVRGRGLLRGVMLDVTDRRHAEAAARQYAERMRRLVDHVGDPLVVHDGSGRLVEGNRAACEAVGCSRRELLALRVEDLLAGGVMAGGPPEPRGHVEEARLTRRDGTSIPVGVQRSVFDWEGKPLHVVLCRDLTEHRNLERQLWQSQKLEEVGLLTGGLAHDFHNMLTAIKGHAELLLQAAGAEPHRADLELIAQAADRATVLTRKLLAFSGRQVAVAEPLDLNALVVETTGLLRPLIGEHIEIRTRLEAEGVVRGDLSLFEQVLINLMVNARDAMPAGGEMTIETSNLTVSPVPLFRYEFVRPGHYVVLRLTDTGTGMDADTLKRVFEPFFTTKAEGKGSGLGLSTAYGIVKEAGGYIMVESQPDEGSSFAVLLPRHAEPAAPPAGPGRTAGRGPESVPVRGSSGERGAEPVSGTVLVVEDEDAVRSLMRRVLESHGHRVLEAADGEGGLSLSRSHAAAIDLLITDVFMPGMSGPALSRILRAERPGLRVILISGYSAAEAGLHAAGGPLFLGKPFSPSQLHEAVRRAFASPPPDLVPGVPES